MQTHACAYAHTVRVRMNTELYVCVSVLVYLCEGLYECTYVRGCVREYVCACVMLNTRDTRKRARVHMRVMHL